MERGRTSRPSRPRSRRIAAQSCCSAATRPRSLRRFPVPRPRSSSLLRSRSRLRGPSRGRAPATWCCFRPPARASTCSATTSIAAIASRPPSRHTPERPRMPRDGFLAALPRLSPLAGAPRESRAMLVYDPTLAWSALLLLSLGVVMVYSASIATAEASAYTGYRPWYFLARHALFVAAGLAAGVIAFQIPVKVWQALAPYLFIFGGALLAAVLIPGVGRSINGSRRWLSLGLVNLQPSELMKLFVVLYASSYAVRRAAFLHAEQPLKQTLLRGFLPLLAVMTLTGALLLHEPDFGACVVIAAIPFATLFPTLSANRLLLLIPPPALFSLSTPQHSPPLS